MGDHRVLSAVLALSIVGLAACDGDDGGGRQAEGSSRGGAASLPGPVPEEVSFAEPDPSSPRAPDFSLTLIDGTAVTGPQLWRERPVVLFFFASWCGVCAEQQTDITGIAERFRDTTVFLGIAGEDDPASIARYLDEHRIPYPVAIDPDLGVWRSYAVREPPHVVVISKGGRVVRGWPGGAERDLIADTLAEMMRPPI